MSNYHISLPIIVFVVQMVTMNEIILKSYLYRIFDALGIIDPVRLFISVMVQSVNGLEFQNHYREQFPQMKKFYSGLFEIYCPEKIRDYVSRITNSMATWKLFLFQSNKVGTQCPELLEGGVSDIDVKTIQSASSQN